MQNLEEKWVKFTRLPQPLEKHTEHVGSVNWAISYPSFIQQFYKLSTQQYNMP